MKDHQKAKLVSLIVNHFGADMANSLNEELVKQGLPKTHDKGDFRSLVLEMIDDSLSDKTPTDLERAETTLRLIQQKCGSMHVTRKDIYPIATEYFTGKV